MKTYTITQKAGLYVAGTRNTGVGTKLHLTKEQAAHELRLGTLIDTQAQADEKAAAVEAAQADAEAKAKADEKAAKKSSETQGN